VNPLVEAFSEGNFVAAQDGNYCAQNLQNGEGTANLSDRTEKPTDQLFAGFRQLRIFFTGGLKLAGLEPNPLLLYSEKFSTTTTCIYLSTTTDSFFFTTNN
jgi:hypothetical protein